MSVKDYNYYEELSTPTIHAIVDLMNSEDDPELYDTLVTLYEQRTGQTYKRRVT